MIESIGEREKMSRIFRKAAKSVRCRDANWYSKDMHNLKRITLEEWEAIFDKYVSRNEEKYHEP